MILTFVMSYSFVVVVVLFAGRLSRHCRGPVTCHPLAMGGDLRGAGFTVSLGPCPR